MEFSMKLNPKPYKMIKDGQKTVEMRLYDEKRQAISVGDIITFQNTEKSYVRRLWSYIGLIPLKICMTICLLWSVAIRKIV